MLTATIKRTRGLTSVKYKFKTSQEANSTWGRMLKKEMEKLEDRLAGFDGAEQEAALMADEELSEVEAPTPSMLDKGEDEEPRGDGDAPSGLDDGSASSDGLGLRITGHGDDGDKEEDDGDGDGDGEDNESVTKGFKGTPVAPAHAKSDEGDKGPEPEKKPDMSSDGMGVSITKTGDKPEDDKPEDAEGDKPEDKPKPAAKKVAKKKVSVKRGKK